MATQKEKEAALKLLLGDDVADATLKTADDNHHTAESVMRLAYKEHQDKGGDGTFGDWMLGVAIDIAEKEAEALKAKKRPPAVVEDEDEDEDEDEELDIEEMPMTKKDFKAMMDSYTADWKSFVSKKEATTRAKETDTTAALKETDDLHTQRIATLEMTVTALKEQLQTAAKELAELSGSQPPAVRNGSRPSQSPDNVTTKAVQQTPINGDFAELMAFIGGPVEGGR